MAPRAADSVTAGSEDDDAWMIALKIRLGRILTIRL